ncbi:hypothetical protein B566_EDAN000849 [Ephemera danica]|nr:hypothetical protein B566_EDAN000849 [Ephemera danica]
MASNAKNYKRRAGTSGDHGHKFESDVVCLAYARCLKKYKINKLKSFKIANNMDHVGAFDDIVLRIEYEKNGSSNTELIFIQTKHKENPIKHTFLDTTLLPQWKKRMNEKSAPIYEYIKSFLQIRQIFDESKNFEDLTGKVISSDEAKEIRETLRTVFDCQLEDAQFVYYTNASVGDLTFFEKIQNTDIVTNILDTSTNAEIYKFKIHSTEPNGPFETLFEYLKENEIVSVKQFLKKLRVYVNQESGQSLETTIKNNINNVPVADIYHVCNTKGESREMIVIISENDLVTDPSIWKQISSTGLEQIMNYKVTFQSFPSTLRAIVGDINLIEILENTDQQKLLSSLLSRVLNNEDVKIGCNLPDVENVYMERRYEANATFLNLTEGEFFQYIMNNKCTVISDNVGMGKSTALKQLTHYINLKSDDTWVEYIKLNMQEKKLKNIELTTNPFDDVTTLLNLDDEEKMIFQQKCKTDGKVALLFDGFDEISSDSRAHLLRLLKSLINTKIDSIVVSTRPNVKTELTNYLLTFSFSIVGFNYYDMCSYLLKYWSQDLDYKDAVKLPEIVCDIATQAKNMEEIFKDVFDDILSSKFFYSATDINENGFTALHLACMKGKENAVISYMRKFNNKSLSDILNQTDTEENTPLMLAAGQFNINIIKVLHERGASLFSKNDAGETALMIASRNGSLEIVKYLVEQGADINAGNGDGMTTLMYVSDVGDVDMVEYLLQQEGIDVNKQDCRGKTALMYAAVFGDDVDILKRLIDHGADIGAVDSDRRTAYMLAAMYGRWETMMAQNHKFPEVKSYFEELRRIKKSPP